MCVIWPLLIALFCFSLFFAHLAKIEKTRENKIIAICCCCCFFHHSGQNFIVIYIPHREISTDNESVCDGAWKSRCDEGYKPKKKEPKKTED